MQKLDHIIDRTLVLGGLSFLIILFFGCTPPPYSDGTPRKVRITHGSGPDAKVYIVKHDSFYHGSGRVVIYGHDHNVSWDDTSLYGTIKVEPIVEVDR